MYTAEKAFPFRLTVGFHYDIMIFFPDFFVKEFNRANQAIRESRWPDLHTCL